MKYIITLLVFLFVSPAYAEHTINMLNKRDDGAKMVYSEDIVNIDIGHTVTWVPTSKGHNFQRTQRRICCWSRRSNTT